MEEAAEEEEAAKATGVRERSTERPASGPRSDRDTKGPPEEEDDDDDRRKPDGSTPVACLFLRGAAERERRCSNHSVPGVSLDT